MRRTQFDGEVLNPQGKKVFIPYDAFRRLKGAAVIDQTSGRVIRAVIWNKKEQMYEMTKLAACLLELWTWKPEFKPSRKIRAIDPARLGEGGAPRDSGRFNALYMALGPDLSGTPFNGMLKPQRPEENPSLPEGYVWVDGVAQLKRGKHDKRGIDGAVRRGGNGAHLPGGEECGGNGIQRH